MKFIRYLLYGALIVVGLVLFNTWQKEHQPPIPQTTSSKSVSNITTSIKQIAQAKQIQKESSVQATSPILKQAESGTIVHVHTDMLNASISTLGADMVKLNLNKYFKTLKKKEHFLLLNDDPDTLYISQSGLYESNGFRSKKPLILYSTAQKHYVLKKGKKQLSVIFKGKTKDGLNIIKQFTF